MTSLTNGEYLTKAGSRVTISGKHSGIHKIEFDWLEEGACPEARPNVDTFAPGLLAWDCDCCGGGSAPLVAAKS